MLARLLLLVCLLLLLAVSVTGQEPSSPDFSTTYHQPSGNRWMEGYGTFPDVETITLDLDGVPLWGLADPASSAVPVWMVALADGAVLRVYADQTISMMQTLPPEAPPVYRDGDMRFFEGQARHSPVLPVERGWVYVTEDGAVVLHPDDTDQITGRLALDALPDARLVINAAGQIAVYGGATDQRYVHGIMGDALEGSTLAILAIEGDDLRVIGEIVLSGDEVFEGQSPIWADVDQDGSDDLITTVSNASGGAQIRVYGVDGALIAASDPIGRGGRWRHQLAWGAFGHDGTMQLIDVLTPHIGGVVEFFELQGDRLVVVAQLPGYTSHIIGSRNLDMAVAGDFNGDGQSEIVLPDQARRSIAGIQASPDGAVVVWSLDLPAPLTSNLAAMTLPDGRLALGAGTANGQWLMWVSQAAD